jgi:hypothetical protein
MAVHKIPRTANKPSGPRYFGLGDYANSSERSDLHGGRQQFMLEVKKEVPSVLRRLAGQPLAEFQQLAAAVEAQTGRNPSTEEWNWCEFEDWGLSQRDRLPSLLRWAEDCHLTDQWCIEYGSRTLTMWYRFCRSNLSADRLVKIGWDLGGYGCFVPSEDKLENTMHLPVYDFTHTTWEAAEKEIRESFEDQLKAYRQRMEDLAVENGWVRKSEKRTFEDCRWLAWYQCGGAELADIHDYLKRQAGVKQTALTTSTIATGIRDLAKEIGLIRRHGRVGRRPKRAATWYPESATP